MEPGSMKFVFSSLVAGAVLGLALSAQAQSVNIYSTRQIDLIEPVLDAFTAKTGIDTEVLFLKKGLVDRVVAEGRGSPADVMLTTDIVGLVTFVDEGVTQAVVSDVVSGNIPAGFRDDENQWFGLTKQPLYQICVLIFWVIYCAKRLKKQNSKINKQSKKSF